MVINLPVNSVPFFNQLGTTIGLEIFKAMEPDMSIIIPTRNEGQRIVKAIRSWAHNRSKKFPLEFVIVDDASNDGCCTGLENLLNEDNDTVSILVVKMNEWCGIPYARNIGAAYAKAPVLVITDANVEASFGWDLPVIRNLKPGRVLCATIADAGSSWRGYGCLMNLPSMEINWLPSPFCFKGQVPVSPCTGTVLHADLFRNAGGYDTAMPVYGAAEPEFSVRLWLYGAEIISCAGLVLYHRFRPSREREPFLKQIAFTQAANYLRFGLLYLDENKMTNLLKYWKQAAPDYFDEALQQAENGKAWERRRHLQQNFVRDFAWYLNHFGLYNQ